MTVMSTINADDGDNSDNNDVYASNSTITSTEVQHTGWSWVYKAFSWSHKVHCLVQANAAGKGVPSIELGHRIQSVGCQYSTPAGKGIYTALSW